MREFSYTLFFLYISHFICSNVKMSDGFYFDEVFICVKKFFLIILQGYFWMKNYSLNIQMFSCSHHDISQAKPFRQMNFYLKLVKRKKKTHTIVEWEEVKKKKLLFYFFLISSSPIFPHSEGGTQTVLIRIFSYILVSCAFLYRRKKNTTDSQLKTN